MTSGRSSSTVAPGSPEARQGRYAVTPWSVQRLYRPFIWTSLLVALIYGFGTGAGMMLAPAFGIDRGLWWIVHGQAHGVAQIFGWGGLFMMGVSFHVVPRFRNWGRTVEAAPAKVCTPANVAEVVAQVQDAAREGGSVRVVGGAHSFSPVCATSQTLMSLDRLAGLIEVEPESRRVRVHAGMRLHALGASLAEHGLALENMGDIDVQSIAGAVSTGTHGTGDTLGSLSTPRV